MSERTLDFSVTRLGNGRFASPMQGVRFTAELDRVICHSSMDDIRKCLAEGKEPPSMEVAGPREQIFHDPANLACGIVTCGGLCPGLNDVIRSIVLSLYHLYGSDTQRSGRGDSLCRRWRRNTEGCQSNR